MGIASAQMTPQVMTHSTNEPAAATASYSSPGVEDRTVGPKRRVRRERCRSSDATAATWNIRAKSHAKGLGYVYNRRFSANSQVEVVQ